MNYYVTMIMMMLSSTFGAVQDVSYPDIQIWGINNDVNDINVGEVPVKAVLTIYGLTNIQEDPNGIMCVNLIHRSGVGTSVIKDFNIVKFPIEPEPRRVLTQSELDAEIADIREVFSKIDPNAIPILINSLIASNDPNNWGEPDVVYFRTSRIRPPWKSSENYGHMLLEYKDQKRGREDVIIDFAKVDDPDSPLWSVYQNPFNVTLSSGEQIKFTSSLLTFLDYKGTGHSLGFLLSPKGISTFTMRGFKFEVTLKTYGDRPASTRVLTWRTNRPPFFVKANEIQSWLN